MRHYQYIYFCIQFTYQVNWLQYNIVTIVNRCMSPEKKLFLISCLTFMIGLTFFAWYKSWFMIVFEQDQQEQTLAGQIKTKQTVTLSLWNNQRWQQEKAEIITSEHREESLQNLITAWLRFAEQEYHDTKQVLLQSIALNTAQTELMISFDRNPLNKQDSTVNKLMVIEGLLKTIRTFDPQITEVRFLANHQPINDAQLEFTKPWPITGFVEKN